MTTDARVIRADRFAEIGIIIQRDAGIIIDRWSRRAVQEKSQGQRIHYQVLLDDLPKFLSDLGRGLTEAGDPFNCPHYQSAVKHGEQRWEAGWSLSELIRDYRLLRLVLLDYLEDNLERPLELREVMAVGLALDEAIEASVARYLQFCDAQSRQQTEALRAADARKNEFLAILAHELRNPLAPLRNSLEVIRLNGSDLAMMQQVREIMERQVQQMSRLVDDLQDMSRVALGKLVLRKERVDLRTVLKEAIQTAIPVSEARQHELSVEISPTALWVDGDPTRLIQVFSNLLNNAIKYTPHGGRLQLRAGVEGKQAVVRVSDDGIGIPREMLTKIFDLFTQIEPGSERAQGGLGIGLSLVLKLVELHGGSIAVHSDGPQTGSEFTVRFPVVPAGPAQSIEGSDVAPAAVSSQILVVEDNADGRRSLALLLKLVGHQVLTAENGRQGIEAAKASAPDIALIDIGLPDLDGYEVAKELRSLLGDRIFLVALTGFSQPEDRQRAQAAGFDSHLTKPVEFSTLQKLLAQVALRHRPALDGQSVGDADHSTNQDLPVT